MDTSDSIRQQKSSTPHPAATTSKEPSPRKDQDNSTSGMFIFILFSCMIDFTHKIK